MKIDLNDAIVYLRELLIMSKQELLREAGNHPNLWGDKIKRTDILAFAFERKFDSNSTPPLNKRINTFNARFGKNSI